jgi:hypothetical protein
MIGSIGGLSLLCAGCSNDRPPLIEEYTGTGYFTRAGVMSSISTDSAYRSAYILLSNGVQRDGSERHAGQFCPEPPPDAAQAVSAALAGALRGKVDAPTGQTGGEVAAEASKAISTAVAPLVKRSQGLQFFRDQAFYYCVGFLNGVIQNDTYAAHLTDSAQLAAALIALEILNPGAKAQDQETLSTPELVKAIQAFNQLRAELAKASEESVKN